MLNVILINEDKVPHYRIGVYEYLTDYLGRHNISLRIVSSGIQGKQHEKTSFQHINTPMGLFSLVKVLFHTEPDIVIYWIRPGNYYLFPFLVLARLLGHKLIYWGHGWDLYSRNAKFKKAVYNIQFRLSDAILLYGEHLKKFVNRRFHSKIFVANNTTYSDIDIDAIKKKLDKKKVLAKYNIHTTKNIICVGRIQRRKKIDHLVEAFKLLDSVDLGLILAGPDSERMLEDVNHDRIYKLGPVYGTDKIQLLCASDIFCLPGLVGLSIVDAFQCGLPFVTEEGPITPEIMYLKDGVNGFIIPQGDIHGLAEKLQLLLENANLRERFSQAAKKEIATTGHIDTMCKGFLYAIRFTYPKS